jgi:catechol 2,3-dioxygenase-like lactoylglutathione lyase family enzyme
MTGREPALHTFPMPVTPPTIECERFHPTLAVPDVPAAVRVYTEQLGFSPGFTWGDPVTFAGVSLGNVQLFLQQGDPSRARGVISFAISDADAMLAYHTASGVNVVEPIADRDYGLRDYAISDPYGHRLSFGHYIYSVGQPIPIERVDVPVRLEKRLAALLHDLAAHKRMSLASCLEETLLHVIDGAGPHTPSDLRAIAALKAKHGIDYDTHGSYRFVEWPQAEG